MTKVTALALALITGFACSAGGPGPGATLDAYSRALREGDYGAAYGHMSEAFRSKYTREQFVAMLKQNAAEVRETGDRLGSARKHKSTHADFEFSTGETFQLVFENGRWFVASNLVDFYGMDTPEQSVRSFARAFRLKRWEVLYQFVPENYRAHMSKEDLQRQFVDNEGEIAGILAEVLAAVAVGQFERKGNEARLAYAGSKELRLVREGCGQTGQLCGWRVQDLD